MPTSHPSELNCLQLGNIGERIPVDTEARTNAPRCLSLHQGLTTNSQEPALLVAIADLWIHFRYLATVPCELGRI